MSNVPEMRVCSKCGTSKPASEFYRGSGNRCKQCHNRDCCERQQRNREAASERMRQWRAANREKSREGYRRQDARRKDKRAAYRQANRESRIAYNREYRGQKAAQVRASNALYREKNRLSLRERQRQWREQNPERYAEIHAAWKQRNPDMVKAAAHRRRLKERSGGTYTPAEWQAVKARHNHRCVMCGRHESEVPLCVDHVIPLDRGGRNTADNLQPLCRSCNSKKHTRSWDWRWRKGPKAWPKLVNIRQTSPRRWTEG